jgi:putative chitinase
VRAIDVIRLVAKKARPEYLKAFELGDGLLAMAEINTPLRLSHFLAQCLHEARGLEIQWESGNYTTASRLFQIFGEGNHTASLSLRECENLVSKPMPAREKAIFERTYGLGNPKKAAELGNTRPGDGWLFRGGGVLQTTGGYNYKTMGERCGVDFYNHPELIVTAEHALKPALAEWTQGGLNAFADRDDILSISRKINLGNVQSKKIPNGWDDRQAWYRKVRPLIAKVDFQIAQSIDVPSPSPYPPSPKPSPVPQPTPQPSWLESFLAKLSSILTRKA